MKKLVFIYILCLISGCSSKKDEPIYEDNSFHVEIEIIEPDYILDVTPTCKEA